MADDERLLSADLSADIPGSDAFFRSQPAELELSPESVRLARQAVDFGCAVLLRASEARVERRIRDLVASALLRRALVTTEGVIVLMLRGLMEPAFATFRTLLDIDLALDLVFRDGSDRMAKRLALACAIQYKSHGQDMLANPTTREGTLRPSGRIDRIMTVSRSYAELLKSPVFDDVRAEVQASSHWHGFRNTESAFASLGRDLDYHMTYDAASWFVHGANVEHDLSPSSGDQVRLRALVERDPAQTRSIIGLAITTLMGILDAFLKDRALDAGQLLGGHGRFTVEDGRQVEIGAFAALNSLIMREFDVRPDSPYRRVAP